MEHIISTIYGEIAKGNDGSYSLDMNVPSKGYMVGGQTWTMVASFVDHDMIREFITSNKATLSQPRMYVGWWRHNGKVYLDVSENVHNAYVARIIGKSNGEIAIWDVENNAEIVL